MTNPDTSEFPAIFLGLTRDMDANLDFDVDMHDLARLQNRFIEANATVVDTEHATWYSLADWGISEAYPEADGDVDLDDFCVLRKRLAGSGTG